MNKKVFVGYFDFLLSASVSYILSFFMKEIAVGVFLLDNLFSTIVKDFPG